MSTIDDLISANRAYVETFDDGRIVPKPSRGVAIVTCMDSRIDPNRILGLGVGDAHVIRNAGGRTREALRSLVVSQQTMGTIEVMVMQHTDCGMLVVTDENLRDQLSNRLGADAEAAAREFDFMTIPDLRRTVLDDVTFLRESPLISDEVTVRGFIYDCSTGEVNEVE